MIEGDNKAKSDPPDWIKKSWWELRGWGPPFISGIFAVVPLIVAIFSSGLGGLGWLLAVGVALLGAFSLFLQVHSPTYRELQRQAALSERRGHAVQEALNKLLHEISQRRNWYGPQFRSSVYYLSSEDFVMITRNSADHRYEKPGRRKYPANQGVIGKAWRSRKGVFSVRDLPKDRTRWEEAMVEDYGISPEDAENLQMQSLSIGAIRLDSSRDGSVGVVVFESLESRGVSEVGLGEILESDLFNLLVEYVASFAPVTPRGNVETVVTTPSPGTQKNWEPIRREDE